MIIQFLSYFTYIVIEIVKKNNKIEKIKILLLTELFDNDIIRL